MPFQSQAQWRWAFATDQEFAHRWAKMTPGGKRRFALLAKRKRTTTKHLPGKHNQADHGRKGPAGSAGRAAYIAARSGGASHREALDAGKRATGEVRQAEQQQRSVNRAAQLRDRANRLNPQPQANTATTPAKPLAQQDGGLGLTGTPTKAYGVDPNTSYRMTHRIVEMDDLIPSNTRTGGVNPGLSGVPAKDKVQVYLEQSDMFNEGQRHNLTDGQVELLRHIDSIASRPARVRDFIQDIAKMVDAQPAEGQGGFFGGPLSLTEIYASATRASVDRGKRAEEAKPKKPDESNTTAPSEPKPKLHLGDAVPKRSRGTKPKTDTTKSYANLVARLQRI